MDKIINVLVVYILQHLDKKMGLSLEVLVTPFLLKTKSKAFCDCMKYIWNLGVDMEKLELLRGLFLLHTF